VDTSIDRPIGIGIAGLGRAGWDLHAAALAGLSDLFRVVSAFDPRPARVEEAGQKFGFQPPTSYAQLLGNPKLDLVVLSVPSHLHEALCLQALDAGKHVLVEKPFTTDLQSADRMIEAAARSGRIVSCNQNMRFFSDFLKIRKVIASGQLGRILQIRIAWHRFRRRWDWQTLKEFGGGNLNNDGSHLVDLGLLLLGEVEPLVFARMERTWLSSGDAENHVKIVLSSPGSPVVDLEMTDNCAYAQPNWLIMGSQGALTGTPSRLEWKYIDPQILPQRVVSREPTEDRSFNTEQIDWNTESCEFREDHYAVSLHRMYEDLHNSVRYGKPASITLESLRRQIKVLEECRHQGGQE